MKKIDVGSVVGYGVSYEEIPSQISSFMPPDSRLATLTEEEFVVEIVDRMCTHRDWPLGSDDRSRLLAIAADSEVVQNLAPELRKELHKIRLRLTREAYTAFRFV